MHLIGIHYMYSMLIGRSFICFAVQLGSIPELPAISCKEIKASDGERGVSGNYWFDSVIPGKTILLYCDMDIVGW